MAYSIVPNVPDVKSGTRVDLSPPNVVRELVSLLRYYHDLEIGDYLLPEEFFRPVATGAPQPAVAAPEPAVAKKQAAAVLSDDSLRGIAADIEACALCREADGSFFKAYGCGPENARLFLLLGDDAAGDDGLETFLNDEEDRLLTRMLQAIGCGRHEVFLAALSKCFAGSGKMVDSSHCMSFLLRQLAIVRPRVLCLMGGRAAQVMLRSTEPLSRIRGRFSPLPLHPNTEIRVMATYHPRLLLQHEELKQASWADLKKIKQALA